MGSQAGVDHRTCRRQGKKRLYAWKMDTRCAYGFSAGRWEDLSLISLSRLFLSSFHFSNLLHAAISFGLRRMVARSLSLALLYILVSIDQYSVYTKSWILPDYLAVSCL